MNLTKGYLYDQFLSIVDKKSTDDNFKLKVKSDTGQTKWINVSLEQLEQIADIVINLR